MEYAINLNILLLGDSSSGKMPLLNRYVDNSFPVGQIATIGVEYKSKIIKINDIYINLQIWDTSGQERFRGITKTFLRGSDGIMLVYDITNKSTIDHIESYIYQIDDMEIKRILVGNNCEQECERSVSKEYLSKFCEKYNIEGIEVSAKTGENVSKSFEMLVKSIIGDKSKEELIEIYRGKNKLQR